MTAYRFSANTGFLWKELPFLERIRRAAVHGFDAVEFHDEAQREDRAALKRVLTETGLPVVGLNVRMGDTSGCAAIPGAGEQARAEIAAAIEVAEDIGAAAIHVLAGNTAAPEARDAYLESLRFALEATDRVILIEPICRERVPDYYLNTIEHAAEILAELDHPRLKIMFDCYHIQREGGAVLDQFNRYVDRVGHVQIASTPDRAEPFPGQLDYRILLPGFRTAGYAGFFGCEYHPRGRTEDGLAWRELLGPARDVDPLLPAARRRIALIAHDGKKSVLADWVERHRALLAGHHMVCTGTTGSVIRARCPDFEIQSVKSGPLGGDLQIGAMIADGGIDALIFFTDPLSPHPHDVDVKALARLATVYDIPMACSPATATLIAASGFLGAADQVSGEA